MLLPELQKLERLLVEAAEVELLPRLHRVSAGQKADGSLLTEADVSLQQHLIASLAKFNSDIPVLGEELPAEVQQALLADAEHGVWCLDPLDGTRNFASGFPVFAISLALIRQGRVELGLVYDPLYRLRRTGLVLVGGGPRAGLLARQPTFMGLRRGTVDSCRGRRTCCDPARGNGI
jgi:fructose-1,6-bisphosphatase/inositol monophosphatase family enzyme